MNNIITHYTDKMIQFIKNEYPNSDNTELAKKLNISKSALTTKASKLGIKKSKKYKDRMYKKCKIIK